MLTRGHNYQYVVSRSFTFLLGWAGPSCGRPLGLHVSSTNIGWLEQHPHRRSPIKAIIEVNQSIPPDGTQNLNKFAFAEGRERERGDGASSRGRLRRVGRARCE